MACGCNIVAHENEFNRAILTDSASYFTSADDVKKIITQPLNNSLATDRKQQNLEKIKKIYTWEKIINKYEQVLKEVFGKKKKSNY